MNNEDVQREMFIVTMVHDLRNPLQAQMSCLRQLKDGAFGRLNKEQNEILDLTLESCSYMKNLLVTILETYKNENGQIVLDKKFFNPSNLVKTALYENISFMKEKNLEFTFKNELEEKENVLYADEKQIRRVIENILNNQISYAFPSTKLNINLYKSGKNIAFSFENTSPEIKEDVKNEIFEKFKTKQVVKQKFSTGLGLYLAKQIVNAHGGGIYLVAQKTSNKFIFEIPINNITKNQVVW